jgi:hypothetical protein
MQGPAFYLKHLKRLWAHKIQPYFVPGTVHQLEIIERLLRAGVYMGPMNLAIAGYGGSTALSLSLLEPALHLFGIPSDKLGPRLAGFWVPSC